MKKFKNLDFLKDLVESDFFLLSVNNRKTNFSSLDVILFLKNFTTLQVLNLLQLQKQLKFLIRSLRFLFAASRSLVFIFIENLFFLEFFEKLRNSSEKSFNFQVGARLPVFKKQKQKPFLRLFLGIFSQMTSHRTSLNFLRNNIFFAHKMNSRKEKNQFGNYKISNEINGVKKVIFLFVLIDQVFQKSYQKKKFVKKKPLKKNLL